MRSILTSEGSAARTAARLVVVASLTACVPLGLRGLVIAKLATEAAFVVAVAIAARSIGPAQAARAAYRCSALSVAATPAVTVGKLLVVIAAVDITTQLCVQLWRSLTSVA